MYSHINVSMLIVFNREKCMNACICGGAYATYMYFYSDLIGYVDYYGTQCFYLTVYCI